MSDSLDPRLLDAVLQPEPGHAGDHQTRRPATAVERQPHLGPREPDTADIDGDGLAKTANLRRDPRASYLVATEAGWSHVVAEGTARFSPPATDPDDAVNEELVDIYRRISGGEHPDWDDFRAAMVRDRRVVLSIQVERTYGIWQG